jgi:hypothetical protein
MGYHVVVSSGEHTNRHWVVVEEGIRHTIPHIARAQARTKSRQKWF